MSIVPEAENVQSNPGNYNFTITLTDAGGDSIDCNFVVTIVSTSCCFYFWQIPRQTFSITGPQGQTITQVVSVPFRYTNCDGELVETTLSLGGNYLQLCAQDNYPEIFVQGAFASIEERGAVRYCVPGQQIFENGEPVLINDEPVFVPSCGS